MKYWLNVNWCDAVYPFIYKTRWSWCVIVLANAMCLPGEFIGEHHVIVDTAKTGQPDAIMAGIAQGGGLFGRYTPGWYRHLGGRVGIPRRTHIHTKTNAFWIALVNRWGCRFLSGALQQRGWGERLIISKEICWMVLNWYNFSRPPPPSLSLSLYIYIYIYVMYIYIFLTHTIKVMKKLLNLNFNCESFQK